jgi:hypothetical protein
VNASLFRQLLQHFTTRVSSAAIGFVKHPAALEKEGTTS